MGYFSAADVMRDMEGYAKNCKNYVDMCAKAVQGQMYMEIYSKTPVTRKQYATLASGSGGRMKNGWYKDVVVLRRGGKETAGAGMKNNNQYYVVRNVIKPQAVHLATKSHAHMSHGRLTGYTKENDFIKEAQQDGERAFDELLEQRFEKV